MKNKKNIKKIILIAVAGLIFASIIIIAIIIKNNDSAMNSPTQEESGQGVEDLGNLGDEDSAEKSEHEPGDYTCDTTVSPLNKQYKEVVDALVLVNPHLIIEGEPRIDIMTVDETDPGWQVFAYKHTCTPIAAFPMIAVIDNTSGRPRVAVPLHHYITGRQYVDNQNLPPGVNQQLIKNESDYARWRSFYAEGGSH